MKTPSAEMKLLLDCLHRSAQNPASLADMPPDPTLSLPEGLDWSAFLALVERHRVLANVYPLLVTHATDEFDAAFRAGWVTSQVLALELEALLDDFAATGILVLPLKGLVLAELLYGDIALRRAGDLDLLVQQKDYSAAEDLLRRRGYQLVRTPNSGYHRVFAHENATVELHFRLGQKGVCQLRTEEVWSRSVPTTFRGRPIRAMQQDDLVLFLCFHLLRHSCSRLLWLLDFSRALLTVTDVSWDLLLAAARNRRMESLLLFCCALAGEAFAAPLPPPIAATIRKRPEFTRKARSYLELELFGPAAHSGDLQPNLMLFGESNLLRRWWCRLRDYLVPNADYREQMAAYRFLGPFLLPFAPVVRLARALRRRGALHYWRMFIHDQR